MKFNDLDDKMREYETASDEILIPGSYVIARLDGRGFTKMTSHFFEKPFDITFNTIMVRTTEALFDCGFDFVYGYTQSDEISMLLRCRNDFPFNGKIRKFNSLLAAKASVRFDRVFINAMAPKMMTGALPDDEPTFDCRIIQLPTTALVIDYFRWRQEDARRNALNGWAYWTLRKEGLSGTKASKMLERQPVEFKINLLLERGIDFATVPQWQRHGIGLVHEEYDHVGFNPIEQKEVVVKRKKLTPNLELPYGEEYSSFIERLTDGCTV